MAANNIFDRNKSHKHAGNIWIAAQRSFETKWMKQKFSAIALEFLNVCNEMDFKVRKVNDPLIPG